MKTMPIFVAEIGINHNGNIKNAKSLIALANNNDIKYVKFQKRDIDLVYGQQFLNSPRVSKWGSTQRDQKAGLEFSNEQYADIDEYCKMIGSSWFASPWDVNSVNFIADFKVPYIKISSASITDIELLKAVKETNIPVILSVGMSNKAEIDSALDIIGKQVEYILWCKSTYPTIDTDMNLSGILTLKELYGNTYKIGFSNHSPHIIYCVAAYIMGAEMIEFHVTLDRNSEGSDQIASIGPYGIECIVKHITKIHNGWGDGTISIAENEKAVMKKLRKVL